MWSSNPRRVLLICALFDCAGLTGILFFIGLFRSYAVVSLWQWILFVEVTYLGLGWLFGSYTVLRWPRLPVATLVQRVLITCLATFLAVALARVLLNPPVDVWLVHRSTQFFYLLPLFVWSLLLRWLLRRGVLLPQEPKMVLVGPYPELQPVLEAWIRTPVARSLHVLSLQDALHCSSPVVFALAPSLQLNSNELEMVHVLQERDPQGTSFTTPLNLTERHLERIPPVLLPESWFDYHDIPWNRMFSLDRQLKRVADLFLASCLLIITSPLISVAALLIWIQDRGPVFYVQHRTGWLGKTFQVIKLRTMKISAPDGKPTWTQPGDQRITGVGLWLRRLRLDELPQLINVLTGEMSLIGPRPERPEFEKELEASIPHYRKRHWMRPGLSGWAQVCAPYAASVEDSELKLSYDLYYLKHFSTWLDLVILFRTIKTVLKAAGR